MVALLSIALGYAFIHNGLQNPRPYTLETAIHIPDPEDTHKVESRLWQDPFEFFGSATNVDTPAKNGPPATAAGDWLSWIKKSPPAANVATNDDNLLWNAITSRATNTNAPVAILGVMLEGGSYAEDKEVRLRVRYAVEMALLTLNLRPEDRSHISTNSVWLTREDGGKHQRLSRYAYEWFETRSNQFDYGTNAQVCVLWLNENDFADRPALRLGSLLTNIPSLSEPGGKSKFYLIGPRSSDTLRALVNTDTNTPSANLANFTRAVMTGHFHILSPEATASVLSYDVDDPVGKVVSGVLSNKFGADFFHQWIATDERIASLISRELKNRLTGATSNTNNVVVLLSEQDTYYGSKLADEWMSALTATNIGVCVDPEHVWQFAYLRGLDGSKPQTTVPERAPSLTSGPEAALETAMVQQQKGQRADGDAQLDYVFRLRQFLEKKDRDMKDGERGRIVAFGLTGSDTYDKLILLQELRRHFPESVFFTTDLDSSLWTAEGFKYAANLLVGSGYPVEPNITTNNVQAMPQQFAPFRDVYQTAVFRACVRTIYYQVGETNSLSAREEFLTGGLYKIGRHGPVGLAAAGDPRAPMLPGGLNLRKSYLAMALMSLIAVVLYFFIAVKGGIQGLPPCPDGLLTGVVKDEVGKECTRQITPAWLLRAVAVLMLLAVVVVAVQKRAWDIASTPGEEPWDFTSGVSIWFSEDLRMLACVGAGIFAAVAWWRQRYHRKKLWGLYFCGDNVSPETWDKFISSCQDRWRADFRARLEDYRFWRKAGPAKDNENEAETERKQERTVSLHGAWIPPFIAVPNTPKPGTKTEVYIHAAALFRCYLRLGQIRHRLKRSLISMVLYVLLAFSLVYYLQDVPTFLLIRGPLSHHFDTCMLGTAVFLTLLVLFYVFDAALLTKRLLDYVGRHATLWPEAPLKKNADRYGVSPQHLDGLLDVDFAAVQTGEIGPLMFGPILLLLILLFSRISYFDCWSWPTGLIVIFVMNFVAASTCWWLVRRATEKVRQDALGRLDAAILAVNTSGEVSYDDPAAGNPNPPRKLEKEAKENYVANLKTIRQQIENERRGAFAPWFQDPTCMAVFIPSSVSGIISLVFSLWLSK